MQKTNCMLFSNSISALPGNISLNNNLIELVDSTKFPGLIIDNKLSWREHIANQSKLLSRNVGIINKLKSMFPSDVLLNLYSTLVLSYLNYGILAWGNSSRTNLDKLLLVQKRAIRIICHKSRLTHTDQLFHTNKVLKVYDLYDLRLGCFMYQLNSNELPHALSMLFSRNENFHSYPTRQSSGYHLPMLRTLYKQKTLIYTGPVLWNSLNESLKHSPSLVSFKYNLKSTLINNYTNSR